MAKKTRYADIPGLERDTRRRPSRVADVIRNEIAMLLLGKIKDPRVAHVTVTSVTVTNDLRTAHIFFSYFGDENEQDILNGLQSAKGFIRSHLARTLNLRYVPELQFKRDLTLEQQEKIEKLLRETQKNHEEPTS